MAYRRRQVITKGSTFKDEIHNRNDSDDNDNDVDNKINRNYSFPAHFDHSDVENAGSLAARAIKASAVHRDSAAYVDLSYSPPSLSSSQYYSKGSFVPDSNSVKDSNDPKYGLWGVLAWKAKSILDEDDQFESSTRMKSTLNDSATGNQFYYSHQSAESGSRMDNARLRKGIDAITSSLNHLGDTLGNAFEEGRTIVEHKTADIIQETRNKTAEVLQESRRIHMRRRGGGNSDSQDQATVVQNTSWKRPVIQPVQTSALANPETQLKASRDVAMATAAKAKLLLRELKTVKADLAFAKERCSQLEEENKRLRESREKGDNPADDDLIRLQLETLLAEKARLAHENSIYARENRFLREIVEYHQLTMQDVVYLDEGAEEVTEVYPFSIDDAKVIFCTPMSPTSPSFLPELSSLSIPSAIPSALKEHTREVPKEVPSPATSLTSSTSSLPQKMESSEVPILIKTNTADETVEATHNTPASISEADNTTGSLVSST